MYSPCGPMSRSDCCRDHCSRLRFHRWHKGPSMQGRHGCHSLSVLPPDVQAGGCPDPYSSLAINRCSSPPLPPPQCWILLSFDST